MASINPTITRLGGDGSGRRITWAAMTRNGADDTGAAIEFPEFADRSVQVFGTFGTGGTVIVEGSNDGSNYYTLTDHQGNALSFTAAKIEEISELVKFARPRTTAGDATTSLTVAMVVYRPTPMRT